jgi:hypothetical protein
MFRLMRRFALYSKSGKKAHKLATFKNVKPVSAIASSYAPCFENSPWGFTLKRFSSNYI